MYKISEFGFLEWEKSMKENNIYLSHSFTAFIQTIYVYTKVKNTFALCASNKWYCKILFLSLRNDQELRFAHL